MPLVDGRSVRYVNFDNAASAPALRQVADVVAELVCESGKYDLDLFGGRYVGVRGLDLGTGDGPRKIEVTGLEVLPKR